MAVRVYLFTGFLESGKTSFIQDTILDPGFNEGEKTLLIACEEGEEAYNETALKEANCNVVYLDKEEDVTPERLLLLNNKYQPTQVLVEYNGMWDSIDFINEKCPSIWSVVQILTTINSDTFEMYYNNMRSLFLSHVANSDLIVVNRCDENTKKYLIRTSLKTTNPRGQIVYESKDRKIINLTSDDLPFNVNDNYIEVNDIDYGIFCMDINEHPDTYENKTIKIKGKFMGRDKLLKDGFILGRPAMVCCAEDMQLMGLVCVSKYAKDLIPNEWVILEGTIGVEFDKEFGNNIPVLYVDRLEGCKPLENEVVGFD